MKTEFSVQMKLLYILTRPGVQEVLNFSHCHHICLIFHVSKNCTEPKNCDFFFYYYYLSTSPQLVLQGMYKYMYFECFGLFEELISFGIVYCKYCYITVDSTIYI